MVRRLLKRYKDSFNIIDEISAEKTISMWIHEQGLDTPTDGSMNTDDTLSIKKIKKHYINALRLYINNRLIWRNLYD